MFYRLRERCKNREGFVEPELGQFRRQVVESGRHAQPANAGPRGGFQIRPAVADVRQIVRGVTEVG